MKNMFKWMTVLLAAGVLQSGFGTETSGLAEEGVKADLARQEMVRAAEKSVELPGLSVDAGQLELNGNPYRGMGANYFSLFYRTLKDPSDRSYEEGLKSLSEAKIPFVRFMACGFWPVEWDLYMTDKESYFKRLDAVVQSAERHHVGLIPSLFWNIPTFPDLVGESMDQLGNPKSKTIAFIEQYTKEVVLRYRNSPAIWGWEFANEYNIQVDLPNASDHRPKVVPKLKTALKRTARDEFSSQAMHTAFKHFAATVRKYDTHRVLITGNAIPSPYAYHNTKERSWKRDTRAQYERILLQVDFLLYFVGPDSYLFRFSSNVVIRRVAVAGQCANAAGGESGVYRC